MAETLLRTRQAAERLGVHPDTLRQAVKAGTLRPVRLYPGAHPRFRASDVDELVGGRDKAVAA